TESESLPQGACLFRAAVYRSYLPQSPALLISAELHRFNVAGKMPYTMPAARNSLADVAIRRASIWTNARARTNPNLSRLAARLWSSRRGGGPPAPANTHPETRGSSLRLWWGRSWRLWLRSRS